MKFSYNWLRELVPSAPKPKKLAEVIGLSAFEVEGVEKVADDVLFSIDVLPNRIADASGHIGMAREIAAILNTKVALPKTNLREIKNKKTASVLSVTIADKKLCSRYVACVVEGVEVKESPIWLRQRLEICGLRSINNIVDATNYVMLETGQPLHAFDFDKLAPTVPSGLAGSKKKITVRTARAGEKITTLDGQECSLDSSMLLITDGDRALAIAGIKGGTAAEISQNTKTIVLEAARFDGPAIRKTSQTLGIRTDASTRFSVGIDPELAAWAMKRVAALIQQIAGGSILSQMIDVYPRKEAARQIRLRPQYVERILGVEMKVQNMISILKRLECSVVKKGQELLVAVPSVRRDLRIEEDLVEEIGRIYGYQNISSEHPIGGLVPPEFNAELYAREQMRDMLASLGFHEAYNYSFVGEKDIAAFGGMPSDYLELANPTRPEFAFLRKSLLPGLFKNAEQNLKHQSAIKMFEVGNVFEVVPQGHHKEGENAGGVLAYKTKSKNAEAFFELKGALSALFEKMGLEVWFDDTPSLGGTVLHPHRSARIKINKDTLGIMGEAHPALLEHLSMRGEIAVFELDLAMFARLLGKEKEFRPISRFPSITRDIAVLVSSDTRVVEVEDVIENTAGPLLIDSDLFDLYEGEGVEEEKKSLAFRLVFQATDRTLKDEEVEALMQKLTKTLEENLEWEVRK